MMPGGFLPGVTIQAILTGLEPAAWRFGRWIPSLRRWVLRRIVRAIVTSYGGVEKLPTEVPLYIDVAGRGQFHIVDARSGVCEPARPRE